VLPIPHLNGYKIAGPTVLARISHEELDELFRGYGYTPYFAEGDEPEKMRQVMAATLDKVIYGNLHVRGYYKEEGTTTPFDMAVLNDLDRFHLVQDVIDRVPQLGPKAAYVTQMLRDKLIDHKLFICKYGEDVPEIRDWKWTPR
jgi:phosphoketolase